MFDFLFPKNKLHAHIIKEMDIKNLEILGVSQINQLCSAEFEQNIFITRVTFINETIKYDEREGLVLSEYFEKRRCPKCRKTELIPTKIRINEYRDYLKNEESVAYDAYSEYPSRTNTPTIVEGYCTGCQSAYEIRIKNKDLWIKQSRKLKPQDLLSNWAEYKLENY